MDQPLQRRWFGAQHRQQPLQQREPHLAARARIYFFFDDFPAHADGERRWG